MNIRAKLGLKSPSILTNGMKQLGWGCKFCNDTYKFVGVSDDEGYDVSRNIQDIFPNLEPEYRELFVSGICPKCWDKMFGEENEDEEEN